MRAMCLLICGMNRGVNRGKDVLALSKRLKRMTGQWVKAKDHNDRLKTKLEMLLSPEWRARVLADLGGKAALTRWERMSGMLPRRVKDPLKPHASLAQIRARAANLRKAKAALQSGLERRLRARERRRRLNDAHPNIVFDKVKMDMEGQFRLAPVLRSVVRVKALHKRAETPEEREAREERNAYIRSIKYRKAEPIPVWPFEFRAAAGEGVGMETAPTDVIPAKRSAEPRPLAVPHMRYVSEALEAPQEMNFDSVSAVIPKVPRPCLRRDEREARDDIRENLKDHSHVTGVP